MGRYEVADKADEFWDILSPLIVQNPYIYHDKQIVDIAKKFYDIIEASGWDSPLETRVGDFLADMDDESCYKFNNLKYYSSEDELREDCEGFEDLERMVEIWKEKHG